MSGRLRMVCEKCITNMCATNATAEIAKGHVDCNNNYTPYLRYQMFRKGEHKRLKWMLWNYEEEEGDEEENESYRVRDWVQDLVTRAVNDTEQD
jgi:hypothetical protein